MMIEHPYRNTPYEALSHPEIGCISPSTPQAQLRQQRAKMIARQKIDPRVAAEMLDRLAGMKRLEVDVFLCCTFDIASDLEQVVERYGTPVFQGVASSPFHVHLPYWHHIPLPNLVLDELSVTHSSAYDDPAFDLLTVDFDL
jgi:hypothetical protein